MNKIKNMNDTESENLKLVILHINDNQQTKVWPGSDALVTFPIGDKKVDEFLIKLKTFRMVLPKGLILSVAIIPLEKLIESVYEEDIPVDEELMEELQNDKDYNI